MTRLAIVAVLGAVLLAFGCAGQDAAGTAAIPSADAGVGNVSFGGQQDIGELRGVLEAGGVPGPDTLDANGFFNEHYAPLPASGCTNTICLTPGVAVGRDWLTGAHQATLQIAVTTNVDPATVVRKPLNLVVVVDRSGSMVEDARLDKVKVGLRTLVNSLADTDRLAIVQFDDVVATVAEFEDTLDRPQLLALIDELTPRGSTNIHGGLQQGFELATEAFSTERQNRVILLSDGLATAGNTSQSAIIAMADGYVERGIGLTTVGVGLSFDVALMRGLAEHGAGNFYFLEDAAAASEVFTQELDFFVTPLALDVRVAANAASSWRMGEAIGSTLWQGSNASGAMNIPAVFVASRTSQSPDPSTGGRRGGGSMLFIHLTPTGGGGDGKVADIALTYRLPGTSEVITETITLAYPHDPMETPSDTYLSVPEMAKRFAMYNLFLGLRFATRSYDPSCAAAALETTRDHAEAWNTTREDPDIAADIDLIDLYLANLHTHTSAYETSLASCGADDPYTNEPVDYVDGHAHDHAHGCSVSGATPRGVAFIAISLMFAVRRRRRTR